MKFFLLFFALTSLASAQTIVCQKAGLGGIHKVTITDSKVVVDYPLYSEPRTFTNLTQANGLITDNGLAIYLANHYGCIRNVMVITDSREPFNAGYMAPIHFGTCSGGTTPDKLCGVKF